MMVVSMGAQWSCSFWRALVYHAITEGLLPVAAATVREAVADSVARVEATINLFLLFFSARGGAHSIAASKSLEVLDSVVVVATEVAAVRCTTC